MLEQRITDDDKIIRRLRDYGVTRVARLLLENQGRAWCLADACHVRQESQGGWRPCRSILVVQEVRKEP